MKPPRWLVILMPTTSVLSVLAAAGWWWVTWPERTAREFVSLVGAERLDDARNLLQSGHESADLPTIVFWDSWESTMQGGWNTASLEKSPRTVVDVFCGRQEFNVRDVGFEFKVVRRAVTIPTDYWFWPEHDSPMILIPPWPIGSRDPKREVMPP